jgi:hypothetical protein
MRQRQAPTFDAGGGINAISASGDWKHVAVAGRDVMKLLTVDGSTIVEVR